VAEKDEHRGSIDPMDSGGGVPPGAISALLREIASAPPSGAGWSRWLEPGAVVGRFELLREIGRGGFGVVWEARDLKLGRAVAFKAVRAGEDLGGRQERLLREAELAARLSHPNIVTLHDLGSCEQGPYLVLELLRGESLAARLARGAVPAFEAYRVALEVARGLAHAHAEGVIHRDLKPGNVFLCSDGRVKILDFGMAHAFGQLKSPGGTPGYMAPEQWSGASEDERTDVFAFGVLLYQLLSNALPFPDDGGRSVRSREAAPALHLPGTPGLAALAAQLLEKEPGKRPRNGAQILDALSALAPEVERRAAPLARSDPLRPQLPASSLADTVPSPRRRRRHRASALAAALGATALVAAIAADLWRSPALPPLPAVKELAVLPFESIPAGEAEQAQAAGIGELLTDRLARVESLEPGLQVVSARELQKENVASAREARDALGANLALDATLRWNPERIRATVRLVDTATRAVLRTGEVEGPRDDAPAMQGRLVGKVAQMLQLEPREAERRLPQEPRPAQGAFELYLQGRGHLQRYDRIESLESAARAFDRAVERDPTFALAWAGKSEAALRRYTSTRDPGHLKDAAASAQRALELDGNHAAVQLTAGLVRTAAGDYAEAIGLFQRVLELEPASPEAHRSLASAYAAAGRRQEAEATYRRAIELRPSWEAYKDLGVFLFGQSRFEEALPMFLKVVELTPDNYRGYSNAGAVLLQLGRHAEAAQMLERSLQIRPTGPAVANLGSIYFYERRYSEAAALYRRAAELNPTDARLWGSLADAERWSGLAAEAGRDFRKAIALLEEEAAASPRDPEIRSRLAMHRAALGEREKALADIQQALALAPRDGLVLFRAALVFEEQGQRERALAAVRVALEVGYPREDLDEAPPLQALRDDPRYRALVEQVAAASSSGRTHPK
jgi:serine/threonine protein kinase/tetratricopeptide (TPR) repeat protein